MSDTLRRERLHELRGVFLSHFPGQPVHRVYEIVRVLVADVAAITVDRRVEVPFGLVGLIGEVSVPGGYFDAIPEPSLLHRTRDTLETLDWRKRIVSQGDRHDGGRRTMTSIPGRVSPVVIILAAAMIAGCGGAQTSGNQSASENDEAKTTGAGKTASGETASRNSKEPDTGAYSTGGKREPGDRRSEAPRSEASRQDGREAARKSGGKRQPRRVALSLRGNPGTAFSGVCVVGGERTDFAAKTPQRYVFRTQRPGLKCRVVKKGADSSTLRAILLARGERHAQRTNSERSVIAFSLSKRGFSSEVRSSSGLASGGKSSSSIRMSSDQDSSIVTRRIEGEREVAP